MPADLSLFLGALAFGLLAGAAGGMVCAQRPRSLLARGLNALALVALCAPVYMVGLLLILLFGPDVGNSLEVGLLATGVYEPLTENPARWLQSLLIPWAVAGAPLAAICLRMTRASVAETLGADYIRTAAAKGLGPWTIASRHALPVALPPVVSVAGAYIPLLVGNALLVEKVFNIPGIFRVVPNVTNLGDYPVLQGLVIVTAVFVVVANAVVDVVLALLDPRVREA